MVFYRNDIDGLRAVAVVAVLGFHFFPAYVPGGYVGVDVFFVISGFLITGIITAALEVGQFSFTGFYSRRIRRIFPSLAIVLLFTFTAGWLNLFAEEYHRLGWQLLSGASFTSNLLFWHEAGYFDIRSETKPLLHLWSLAIEEQFYLLWPIAVVLCRRWINIPIVVCIVALASFVFNIWIVRHDQTAAFYSPLSRFWELMAGALVATINFRLSNLAANVMSIIGGLLVFVAIFTFSRTATFPGWIALLPTIGATLLIVSGRHGSLLSSLLSLRTLVFVGLISYPLYLWHWPLLTFLRITSGGQPSNLALLITIAISVAMASATYLLVEKPIKILKAPLTPLIACMASLCAVAAVTVLSAGFPSRAANAYALLMERSRPENHGLSDGSCERLVGHSEVAKEVCWVTTPAPQMLIIGDSHAMSLGSGVHSNRTMMVAGSSCLPFLDYTSHSIDEPSSNRNCDKIAASALEAAKIDSIKTIVLATMGPSYFADDEGYFIFKNEKKVPDREAAFVDGYVDTIKKLDALGKNVVFFIDTPELTFDPYECLERQISLAERNCSVSRFKVNQRQRRYRELIDDIVSRVPSLSVYDGASRFCDLKYCRWFDDKGSYYFDKTHLSPHGASIAVSGFEMAPRF